MATRETFLLLYGLVMVLVVAAEASYERPKNTRTIQFPFFNKASTSSEPEQVHVSLAGPGRMKVSWVTSSFNSPSVVQYGINPGSYNMIAYGDSDSYTFLFYKSGLSHHVIVGSDTNPLQDGTIYYYRCGGNGKEYSFRTPPPSGPHVPITFAVVGDVGQTGWSISTLQHVEESGYDVLLFAGDLAYADYYQPLWDSFGQLVSPVASARPWMVTQGNHDVEVIPLLSKAFKSYNSRWSMPYKESGSTSNLYYSFEVAGVHVLMLGSYTDYSIKSEQYAWLQADLAKVDRKRTPWLIAVLHAPWYNSNVAHQGNGAAMMAVLEPVLYDAKVDIMFAGHVHAYERFTRVYAGKADPGGTIQIVIGDGGNREGLANRYLAQPSHSVFREASFGHGQLRISNSTHAHWSWYRNEDDVKVKADERVDNSPALQFSVKCELRSNSHQVQRSAKCTGFIRITSQDKMGECTTGLWIAMKEVASSNDLCDLQAA